MQAIIISVLISFVISIVVGKVLIDYFHKIKVGQHIRKEAPERHQKKSGTPAFGGFIFIIATVITCFFNVKWINNEIRIALISLVLFASVGFMDDILKAFRKKNQGLTSLQKLALLMITATYCTYYICENLSIGTNVLVPFGFKALELRGGYIPFIIFFYTAMTNAVNLTDGLDGLAASISILILIFFAIVSFYLDKYSLSLFCSIFASGLIGFLLYNKYPAKIFMGDTGSLAIGGCIATIAILLKLPLIIVLVGGIFLFETLTTLIQIVVFKFTKKRVFRITPIHHSFEMAGWHEVKIVTVFSFSTLILCIIGLLSIL